MNIDMNNETNDETNGAANGDMAPDRVRMVIDRDVCIGAGQCEMHDDDTFELDDDVLVTIIGDGTLPRDRAAAAADRCPGRAISFVELDATSEEA